MATLIAYQSGDWTGATTFKTLVGGATSEMLTITNSTNTTTSNVASANFTITNTHVVEGFALHCNRVNTTGTVTVGLYKGTTLEREVVVNASDLPASPSWVFFTFATTLTADGSSTYNVRVRGSSAGNATFFRDATAGNWARALRRSTTATIATTDLTIIARELTGQGTNNGTITVTMNSTASTAYGECNIGANGVLSYGTSASTNYILDLAGNLNVWGDGTLNIGTSGTRIPSTSTALLEFTNAVNVDRGLEVRNGGTCNMYGATKTTTQTLLTADANSGQAVVTVGSTSGWVANDVIALASTTRTASQSEKATISTVDSGTQVTVTANLTNTHHGVAPYQGEVVNLTRNVKVRGTSQSLCAYVNCGATSSFTAEYAEFSFLGSATASKRGIDSATTSAGTFSIKFCSIYDYNSTLGAALINGTGSSGSITVEDSVFFLSHSVQTAFGITATSGTPSIQRNYWVAVGGTLALADIGGTFKDNRLGGCILEIRETATIGTLSDIVIHSTTASGLGTTNTPQGAMSNLTIWRCADYGINLSSANISISNSNFYHNRLSGINFNQNNLNATGGALVSNCTFNGGTGASLVASTYFVSFGGGAKVTIDSCTFGNLQTAGTAVIDTGANLVVGQMVVIASSITGSTIITTADQGRLVSSSFIEGIVGFDKFNNTSGSHRAYKRFGQTQTDQSVFNTAAPSEALLPNSASGKLPSGSKKFAVASGTTATVNVYVRKSATYNGNQPRLIVKRNSIAGITTDTVLDTMSVGTGSWEQLSGTTATVSDDCVLEVYVDCDGTAGTVNVDDWSIT